MEDIIIRSGHLVDGTGAAGFDGDLAITDGKITQIGKVEGAARREINADGHVVAPGWVDIHTHYDGQATWDDELGPSSWHGVTTAIMGNCGVGFAPAKPERHDWLIGLMEGVEDIPGAALTEGIEWKWESFPQYLDALETMPRSIDIGAQLPHGALRAYVMGERGANNEAATPEDIEQMAVLVRESMAAGAMGFSTSRTLLHLSRDGIPVPGTFANKDELLGIGQAMGEAGFGVFEMAGDMTPLDSEMEWMTALSKTTGLPVFYALLQSPFDPEAWRDVLNRAEAARAEGANLIAAMAVRPTGLILGWESTVHPFFWHPTYVAMADLPHAEKLKRLRDPEIRRQLLSENAVRPDRTIEVKEDRKSTMVSMDALFDILTQGYDRMFLLMQNGKLDYEPDADHSIAALAKRSNRHPAEFIYDALMANDAKGYIYLPLLNYANFNLDHVHEMMHHPLTRLSLSDGGAHCGVICDASFPTYLLTHWVRDRKRGARLSLEAAIAKQTRDTAQLYGMRDRGVLAEGYRADINVIDLDHLEIGEPQMVHDLPAGGRRLIQKARGYEWTLLNGTITFEKGCTTGEKPGRLLRGHAH